MGKLHLSEGIPRKPDLTAMTVGRKSFLELIFDVYGKFGASKWGFTYLKEINPKYLSHLPRKSAQHEGRVRKLKENFTNMWESSLTPVNFLVDKPVVALTCVHWCQRAASRMKVCNRGVQMLLTSAGAFAAFSLMTIAVGTDYWLYSRGVCRTKSVNDNDTNRKNEEVLTHSGLWRQCCMEGTLF